MNTITNRNRQIIGETYHKIRMDIFTIFRQACIPEEVCEDLVQEVFLKMMGLDVILEDQVKGMAVKIAYQKRIDYLRRRACMNKVHDRIGWMMERSYSHHEVEVKEILFAEMNIIKSMSETDSKIYRMVRFDEKTADEIVLETGLSKRAVESRIYRTRLLVRDNIRRAINS